MTIPFHQTEIPDLRDRVIDNLEDYSYENYIYQAIYGFEIDEIIKPKIKALKGDKEKMRKLYKGIEKLLLNNELSNTKWKDELKKL